MPNLAPPARAGLRPEVRGSRAWCDSPIGAIKMESILPKTLANKPWDLNDNEVITEVNQCGGLRNAMMGDLHYGHIRNKKLAECFRIAYEANQRAQMLLSKANENRTAQKLFLGIRIGGRAY